MRILYKKHVATAVIFAPVLLGPCLVAAQTTKIETSDGDRATITTTDQGTTVRGSVSGNFGANYSHSDVVDMYIGRGGGWSVVGGGNGADRGGNSGGGGSGGGGIDDIIDRYRERR